MYGFKVTGGVVTAIITDLAPAPAELLQAIRCACKTMKCTNCSCAKRGLTCSIHCKCEAQCQNASNQTDDNDDILE